LPQLVEAALAAGLPVIVDACFLRHWERQPMADLAVKLDVPIQIVACSAPEPVLRQRLLARTAAGIDPSDATVEVMEHQRTWIEPLGKDEEAISHWVDAQEQTGGEAQTTKESAKALAQAVVARFRP
jgi:predicted kinase